MGGVFPTWVWTGQPERFLPPPIDTKPPKQRVVADLKKAHENVNFYFYSTSMFVKYIGLKII